MKKCEIQFSEGNNQLTEKRERNGEVVCMLYFAINGGAYVSSILSLEVGMVWVE